MTSDPGHSDAPRRAARVVDVARIAGVSHQTVSRVLNDHPSLRPATREKVLEAMRILHYRPNAAARALSSSRSRMIGILSTSSGEYGPATSIAAVEAAARLRGFSVTIASADPRDRRSIDEAVNHLADLSAEGLVVAAPQTQVLTSLTRLEIGIPFVTLQATSEERLGSRPPDQITGARLATAHLVGLGHRRIGHIAGPAEWLDSEQRLRGFREELNQNGLDAGLVATGDWSASSGYHAALSLIDEGATAVFAGNDQMALGVLHAAHTRRRAVPADVSVVGFDDVPEAAFYSPPLTTVRQELTELGSQAVAVLLGEHDVPPAPLPRLMIRRSTTIAS